MAKKKTANGDNTGSVTAAAALAGTVATRIDRKRIVQSALDNLASAKLTAQINLSINQDKPAEDLADLVTEVARLDKAMTNVAADFAADLA